MFQEEAVERVESGATGRLHRLELSIPSRIGLIGRDDSRHGPELRGVEQREPADAEWAVRI